MHAFETCPLRDIQFMESAGDGRSRADTPLRVDRPSGRGLVQDAGDMTILASEDVRRVIEERGGQLYVWVSRHGRGCCSLALLEADTKRPRKKDISFRRMRTQGFHLLYEADRLLWPRTLVLELHGRRRKIRALWNDQAWVG